MSISSVGIRLDSIPKLLSTEESAKVINNGTTKDEILDLSSDITTPEGIKKLENELNSQDVSLIKGIKIGDQIIKAPSVAELKTLIKSLQTEILTGGKGGHVKENLDTINFEQTTGISVTSTPNLTSGTAKETMAKRAELRLGIVDNKDVKQALSKDIELIEKKYTPANTDNKDKPANFVAAKILLQDMSLLEKKGLLNPKDNDIYSEILTKFIDSYNKNKGAGVITQGDFDKLMTIAKNTESTITSADAPKALSVDEKAMSALLPGTTSTPTEQKKVALDNFKAVKFAAKGSIDDLNMATKEVGLTNEAIKAQGGSAVEGGRSFSRMLNAVTQVESEITHVNQLLSGFESYVGEVQTKIDTKLLELGKKMGLTDLSEIKKIADNPSDPKNADLMKLVKGDGEMQTLRFELQNRQEEVGPQFKELTSKLSELRNAQISGLKALKSIKTIDSEMKTRVAATGAMTQKLAGGITDLNNITKSVSAISLPNFSAFETDLNTNSLDQLKAKSSAFATEYAKFDVAQAEIDKCKPKIEESRAKMVAGMKDLIAKYEATSTASPETIKILKEELKTLEAIKFDFSASKYTNPDDPKYISDPKLRVEGMKADIEHLKTDLTKLNTIRSSMIGKLAKMGPSEIDSRELASLRALDVNVSGFGSAKLDADSAVSAKEISLVAGKGNADNLQVEIEKAISKAEDAKTKDETKGFDMVQKFEDHLTWGTHVGVSLGISAGVGGKYGPVTGKIGVGVEAALKAEYCYGKGPFWLVHVDVDAKIEGEASMAGIFKAHAEISKGLAAGISFNNLKEAAAFGELLAVTIAKVQSPLTSMDDKEEALSQLWGQIKIHSYSADKAAQKYDVQIGNDKTGFGFSYTKSEVTGHYGSATTENPNPDITRADIKDTEKKGEVNLTLGGKPYKLRATVQTSEDVTGGQKDPTPITRFAGQVVIPISVFKDVYKSKTLNSIPPDVWKSMVAVFKEMNPSIALGP
ncbi:MAG: hypothetical protein AABZ74_13795, partial [Cyanobacteriota bacterium]